MILSLLDDIFNPTFSMFFSPNHNADKVRLYDNKLKVKIEELAHYIGNKDTSIGYLTLADFKIAEASYYFEKLYPDHVKILEPLIHIRRSLEQLPAIKKFYENGGIAAPFLPSYAQLKF